MCITLDICIQTHFTYLASNIQNQESQLEKSPSHSEPQSMQEDGAVSTLSNGINPSLEPRIDDKELQIDERNSKEIKTLSQD